MKVEYSYMDAVARAKALGATISDGINWTWANGFPSEKVAWEFISAFSNMDTRGVYPTDKGTYDVRFR